MVNLTGADVLTGTDAKVWCYGDEVGAWEKIELNIAINYDDVQVGQDVDRKGVSWQGEGTLSKQETNSFNTKLFNKLKDNLDTRFTIECELIKKSTGERASYTVNNVSFDSLPLIAWVKGETVKSDINFRFTPSDMIVNDLIG